MTTAPSMDTRVDTLRPAALAGLRWFAVVRPIATAVGVAIPADADLAARFDVTEGIDLSALVRDASSLRSAIAITDDSTRTVDTVGDRIPSVWTGVSSDAAGVALGRHVRRSGEAIEQMRDIAITVDATAAALSRVLVAKYLSIAAIATDLVAGRPMTSVTLADADENREVIAADIAAKTVLFGAAVDVADAAVGEILTVLAASFEGLATRAPYPDGLTVVAQRARSHRPTPSPGATRTDIALAAPAAGAVPRAVAPTSGPGGGRGDGARVVEPIAPPARAGHAATIGGVDPVPLASALAQAAVASASAVGMAAAGGVGAVLNLAVEALDGPHDQGRGGLLPDPSARSGPMLSLNLELDLDGDRDPADPDRPRATTSDDPQPMSAPRGVVPDTAPPPSPSPSPVPSDPPTPSPAAPPVDEPRPTPAPPVSPTRPEPAVGPGPEIEPRVPPDRVEEPAADTNRAPQATPDPGDDGGLALAGDR
ncbi:hypothetical protein ASG12_15600 [Williamsia sp. Leaf354]|uniref:hypothetical protein n=1 Tax=Williamsia sp. Leaf354 TaxID=1736349 RepID=UPI0006F25CA4|nr:hypothetical protein [Williamsia sp. Leaf354]KQR97364.1 hypothetical protein ASG12_15600 [Williamsia sp. Leaf354]